MHAETETRWMVLGRDGRHVSLGRTKPSEAEIATASDALAAKGLSGWHARMQGDYYSRATVTLEPLQRIGIAHDADWQAALTAFHAARRRATHLRPDTLPTRGGRSPPWLNLHPPRAKQNDALASATPTCTRNTGTTYSDGVRSAQTTSRLPITYRTHS